MLIIAPFVAESYSLILTKLVYLILIPLLVFLNLFAVTTVVFNVISKKKRLFSEISHFFLNKQIYPLIHLFYRSSSQGYEKFTGKLIEWNNIIAKKSLKKYNPEDILVLLPHCLQNADCGHKITYDINNCVDCGKCVIKDFKALHRKYKVNIRVATGGTLARKIIKDSRPKVIIAVACYRDLIEGIKDIEMIPTLGVLNNRPNGPCFNTTCDVGKVEELIKQYL